MRRMRNQIHTKELLLMLGSGDVRAIQRYDEQWTTYSAKSARTDTKTLRGACMMSRYYGDDAEIWCTTHLSTDEWGMTSFFPIALLHCGRWYSLDKRGQLKRGTKR